jgi:hypothetical protein
VKRLTSKVYWIFGGREFAGERWFDLKAGITDMTMDADLKLPGNLTNDCGY